MFPAFFIFCFGTLKPSFVYKRISAKLAKTSFSTNWHSKRMKMSWGIFFNALNERKIGLQMPKMI